MKETVKFEPGLYYHEVLKANSDTILFRDAEDRKYFIDKMRTFILPCCEIWAYAVLGNHVHLLIRTHPARVLARLPLPLSELNLDRYADKLKKYLSPKLKLELPKGLKPFEGSYHRQIRYCIRGLKHSYVHHMRGKYGSHGTLWSRNNFTKELPNQEDIGRTILYIHKNPVYHGMVKNPKDWPGSSFEEVLNVENRIVMCNEILELFKGKDLYLAEHQVTDSDFGSKPSKNTSTL